MNIKMISSFLIILSLFVSLNSPALADPKANGEDCTFEDGECISDVCADGTCVECASDGDCGEGLSCIDRVCS